MSSSIINPLYRTSDYQLECPICQSAILFEPNDVWIGCPTCGEIWNISEIKLGNGYCKQYVKGGFL
jgi:predicted RNA-binding Zn-ribbon protein involved in translation (DUF1610 family)